jgi:hypothetical protein
MPTNPQSQGQVEAKVPIYLNRSTLQKLTGTVGEQEEAQPLLDEAIAEALRREGVEEASDDRSCAATGRAKSPSSPSGNAPSGSLPMPSPSPNPRQGEVPAEAVQALAERRFYSERDGGVFDHLPGAEKATLLAHARRDLTAATPAIRSQIDQEWEERLGKVEGERDEAECRPLTGELELLSERLKEVERQREALQAEKDAWCTKAYSRTGWGREWRECAEKAEAALFRRDEQVRQALKPLFELQDWCRRASKVRDDDDPGTRAEAYKIVSNASMWDQAQALHDQLTQPSSNPPQQDREVGEDDDLGKALEMLAKRRLAIVEHVERLREFDAWLSFRGEFTEVLKAFRSTFGTDTSATAVGEASSIEQLLTQPEADLEVPRCGLAAGIRAEIEHLRDAATAGEGIAGSELADELESGPGLKVAATANRRTADRLEALLADCKYTPELLGEETAEVPVVRADPEDDGIVFHLECGHGVGLALKDLEATSDTFKLPIALVCPTCTILLPASATQPVPGNSEDPKPLIAPCSEPGNSSEVSQSGNSGGVEEGLLRAVTSTDALQAANDAHRRTEIGDNKMFAALKAAAVVAREAVRNA